ncbi:MAG TPA: hypothetical protein VGU01_01545 [Sphingomicrobium sp.]|nr:hypothetical protein [Sphingomicrobium sp.]
MGREPGFYWLMDLSQRPNYPNPFVAYWSGREWRFCGSDWAVLDNEEDGDGERIMDRFDIITAIPSPR